MSKNGVIKEVVESSCLLKNDKVLVEPLNKNKPSMLLPKDNSVSMLIYGLKPDIFDFIGSKMVEAFTNNKEDLDNFEFYIPDILTDEIKNGKTVLDIPTKSKWLGLTYQEDIDLLKEHILNMIDKGIYPNNLWN